MKRLVLILIIVAVVGGLAVGTWWYLRQTSGTTLLRRAEEALRRGEYEKARGFAAEYADGYPGDWKGHLIHARALIQLSRYPEARAALDKAAALTSDVSVRIARAEIYSHPALTALTAKDAVKRLEVLDKAKDQLESANKVLEGKKIDEKDRLQVREQLGQNYRRLGRVWRGKKLLLEKQAKAAEASRDPKLAAAKRAKAKAAEDEADRIEQEAVQALKEVVLADASRRLPARSLVDLCIERGDEASLTEARTAIMALESPPPVAATMLAMHDLSRQRDPGERRKRLEDVAGFLDKLLDQHPSEQEVKLARARVAVERGFSPKAKETQEEKKSREAEIAKAEEICDEILKGNSEQGQARMIRAGMLMRQGKWVDAERELFKLKTQRDYARWPEAHFRYAQAALQTGQKGLARGAMRRVVELNPKHARARAFLARSLLDDGFPKQAYADAQALYEAHPQDPSALALYVEAAQLTDQPRLAGKALCKAADESESPEMLVVVAKCKPTSFEGRLAVARALERLGRTAEAEKLLTDEIARDPSHPEPHYRLGRLYAATGRGPQAVEEYRKAIELQPANFDAYVDLAKALDAAALPLRALETLKRLEGRGKVGKRRALLERGQMFGRWGLHAQARGCFEELLKQKGDFNMPALQLSLGRALAALGEKDAARTALAGISAHSRQYVAARQALARLADTDDEKLQILEGLEKAKPDYADVVAQKMDVLVQAGRLTDAKKAFRSFMDRRSSYGPVPARAAFSMVQSLLAASDRAAARDLAVSIGKAARSPQWRRVAILLCMDDKPDQAAELIGPVDKADPFSALLALAMSVQKADQTAALQWARRVEEINQPLSRLPAMDLLAALAVGQTPRAKAALRDLKKVDQTIGSAAEELVGSAKGGGQLSVEAANLLRASMATNLRLPRFATSVAMGSLEARPTCQLAAAIILRADPDAATHRKLLEILRPTDCRLARQVQAGLLMGQGKFKEAADVYGQMTAAEDNPELDMGRASALEAAGQLPEAFALYLKVWHATRNPIAANNAAYLVTQLHPKDAPRLREAGGWMGVAVKARPEPAFYDTKGWIGFLLGEKGDALSDLRRAVRGMPDSPEIHYHLGAVEADAGNRELAGWHLAAAVKSVEAMKAAGREPSLAEAKAAQLAKAALAGMIQKPK